MGYDFLKKVFIYLLALLRYDYGLSLTFLRENV
jgi:hypothetical protein